LKPTSDRMLWLDRWRPFKHAACRAGVFSGLNVQLGAQKWAPMTLRTFALLPSSSHPSIPCLRIGLSLPCRESV